MPGSAGGSAGGPSRASLLWNGGVALIVAGGLAGSGIIGALGAAALAIGLVAALGLLVASAVVDPRSAAPPAPATIVDGRAGVADGRPT